MLFASSLLLISFSDLNQNIFIFLFNFFSKFSMFNSFFDAKIAKSISESDLISAFEKEPNNIIVGEISFFSINSTNFSNLLDQYILDRSINCLFWLFVENKSKFYICFFTKSFSEQ